MRIQKRLGYIYQQESNKISHIGKIIKKKSLKILSLQRKMLKRQENNHK